jgi:hypothetical protein
MDVQARRSLINWFNMLLLPSSSRPNGHTPVCACLRRQNPIPVIPPFLLSFFHLVHDYKWILAFTKFPLFEVLLAFLLSSRPRHPTNGAWFIDPSIPQSTYAPGLSILHALAAVFGFNAMVICTGGGGEL